MDTKCTPMYELLSNIEPSSSLDKNMIIATYGIICAVGLVANIILLISLLVGGRKGTTFKAPSTILILSLAVADTLFLLTLPFSIDQRIRNYWIFGKVICKMEEGIKFLNYYASVFFITAMSVDRYFSICRPATFDRTKARKRLCFISLGIWIMALITVTPILTFAEVSNLGYCTIKFPGYEDFFGPSFKKTLEKSTNKTFECLEDYIYSDYLDSFYDDNVQNKSYYQETYTDTIENKILENPLVACSHPPVKSLHVWLVCNFVIGFVIPFLIITVSYTKIILFKRSIFTRTPVASTQESDQQENETTRQFLKNERSTEQTTEDHNQRAKVLMGVLVPCLILAFAVCWLPYHAWHLAQISGVPGISGAKCSLIQDITFSLAFFNSALNPILNSFFLLNFKERIQLSTKKLRQLFKRKHVRASPLHKAEFANSDDILGNVSHLEMTMVTMN